MTSDEFDAWTADLCRKFPEIAAWLESINAAELLGEWSAVLAGTRLREALDANRRMLAGDEDGLPGKFPSDWQSLPGHVRRIAFRLQPRSAEQVEGYRPSVFPAAQMYRRLKELTAGGMDHESAVKQVGEEFVLPSTHEPRYHCHLCQDTRRIFVASHTVIRMMLDGRFDQCHHRDSVCRCRCDNYVDKRRPLAQYDPEVFFKTDDALWGRAQTEAFRAWCEWKRKHAAEERLKRHENYEPAFASFNREASW